MPLKLYKRGKVWWISGTVHGQKVRETTGSNDKEVAEACKPLKWGKSRDR
ncbi:hypothetical protein [Ciceribacter selenitireducens]